MQGSLRSPSSCSAICQAFVDRERDGMIDRATERELTDLRGALGLWGVTDFSPSSARSVTTSAAKAASTGAGPLMVQRDGRRVASQATVRTDVPAAAAATSHSKLLEAVFAKIRGFTLTTDNYQDVQINTPWGQYLWRWSVPPQNRHITADHGAHFNPGYTDPVSFNNQVLWITWMDFTTDIGFNGRPPKVGWYGSGWNLWVWNDTPPNVQTCDGSWGGRPLAFPEGFAAAYQEHAILDNDLWWHPCWVTEGWMQAPEVGPVAPPRPYTAADAGHVGATITLTSLGPISSAPTVGETGGALCAALQTGEYPKADAALQHPCDRAMAEKFRPRLLFDSAERWRPLDVDWFFEEWYDGFPAHDVCHTYEFSQCVRLTDLSAMEPAFGGSYLDLNARSPHGYKDAEHYQSPYAACRADGLYDCDRDFSANYYKISDPTPGGYRIIDYWMFYRLNYFGSDEFSNEYNHQGDWEAVSVAPSRTNPDTFDFVSFSQHEGGFKSYLRENVRCDDPSRPDQATCGRQDAPTGTRVLSYVANGSHANYPRKCSESLFIVHGCWQEGANLGQSTPERGHDGARRWGNDDAVDALKELPTAKDGRRYDWSRFPGRWGVPDSSDWGQGPKSPNNQSHASNPLANECAKDQEGCALAAFARSRSSTAECSTWFGPGVKAAVCAPKRLAQAVRAAQLGAPGQVRILDRASSARAASGRTTQNTAPGLAQTMGRPLAPGQGLTIRGAVPKHAVALIRVRDGGHVWNLRYRVPVATRRMSFTAARRGAGRLVVAGSRTAVRGTSRLVQ